MQKFAAIAALACTVVPVQKGTDAMYVDTWVPDVEMMPQGVGQDHTLWDWHMVVDGSGSKVIFYESRTEETAGEIDRLQDEINDFWTDMTSTEVTNQYSCELHRNEEINLYYQCTQLTFNNYALDHFGGDMRSYPRWVYEFKRCNLMLAEAECCSITREGIEYECPPCTDITLPMPHPFMEPEVPVIPPVIPEPEPERCAPLPDISMFSVYRPLGTDFPVNQLIVDQWSDKFYCLDMKRTSEYTATLNVKKLANEKTNPDYNLRLNQDDCTTIELKKVDTAENTYKWEKGGALKPYGSPFNGYDALYFDVSETDVAKNFDTKVGYCLCDEVTGVCEGFMDPAILANQ